MSNISKNKVISSLLWKFMERIGVQLCSMIILIILARLLSPKEYGVIAIVNIILAIASAVIQGGMNTALIQKKEIDDIDINTILYTSLAVFSLFYGALYFLAGHIASFFNIPILENIIPIIAFTLIFGSMSSIQLALLTRNMQFKKILHCSLFATILSGATGITMAYNGYGVWSLVGQQLSLNILQLIFLTMSTKWLPKFQFSIDRLKTIWSFSINIMLSNLLTSIFLEIRSLAIGKFYSPSDLSFFEKGRMFPNLIMSNINNSILSVMFPVFSSIQDDKNKMKQALRRCIKTSSFIIFPMMILFAVIAKPFIIILLGDKWANAAPFMQIFALTFMIMPLHQSNLEVIKALGKGKIILKLDLIRKSVELLSLLLTINYGPMTIAMGALLSSIISIFINLAPNRKLINYSYREQFVDILPHFMTATLAGCIAYSICYMQFNAITTTIVQIVIGVATYLSLSYIFRLESLKYSINIIKKRKSNN